MILSNGPRSNQWINLMAQVPSSAAWGGGGGGGLKLLYMILENSKFIY